MDAAPIAFFAFNACLIAWLIYISHRNKRVFEYRANLLADISRAAKKDIAKGRDYRWRYEQFEEVNYGAMVWNFWKPLDSFYTDRSFVELN
jgi:hypothetical protein